MLKIESDQVGCCTSKYCTFKYTCAIHSSASTVREIEGFTPEVFQDDETGQLFCKTAYEQPHGNYESDFHPENIHELQKGFVALPHEELVSPGNPIQTLLSRICKTY